MIDLPQTYKPSFGSINYFEALFRHTRENCVLLMDPDGIVREVNEAFTTCFGYTRDNIIGRYFGILFTDEDQGRGLPEQELKNVLLSGQSNDNNYLVRQNKTITWVNGESIVASGNKQETSILKIIHDINAQKTNEISLRNANALNEGILMSIEDVVVVIDEEMKIVKANRAFNKLFSVSPSGDAHDFSSILQPYDESGELVKNIWSTIKKRTPFSNKQAELTIPGADKRVYEISGTPMEDNMNVLVVAHDTTVQHFAERRKEDIIGFVAHELKNPLANIVLCNELMGRSIKGGNTEQAIGFLERSNSNIMRLNKMISELYDATKVSSGDISYDKSSFNFSEMIDEAISTVAVLFPSYTINLSGKADIEVYGDRFRLIQVVTNYLSNGIKYSPGSSEVELGIEQDKKDVIVWVKDKGLGIPKEQLPYIFSRFFRAEKTKNLEGIGLGLYLCQQIISGHHGKVWAESQENEGSVFYFSVPIDHAD